MLPREQHIFQVTPKGLREHRRRSVRRSLDVLAADAVRAPDVYEAEHSKPDGREDRKDRRLDVRRPRLGFKLDTTFAELPPLQICACQQRSIPHEVAPGKYTERGLSHQSNPSTPCRSAVCHRYQARRQGDELPRRLRRPRRTFEVRPHSRPFRVVTHQRHHCPDLHPVVRLPVDPQFPRRWFRRQGRFG